MVAPIVSIDEICQERDLPAAVAFELRGLVERRISNRQRRRRRRRHAAESQPSIPNGTVFRLVEYRPWRGAAQPPHRVDRLRGRHLGRDRHGPRRHSRFICKAGDVLVQRGTIHNWVNRGTEPCVVAFVLVAAKPVERAGKSLTATN